VRGLYREGKIVDPPPAGLGLGRGALGLAGHRVSAGSRRESVFIPRESRFRVPRFVFLVRAGRESGANDPGAIRFSRPL
jgi:hypothetical protein